MLKTIRSKVLEYYKNNSEISGFKGLVKKLACLEEFSEENVLKICKEYKIDSIESLSKHVPKYTSHVAITHV